MGVSFRCDLYDENTILVLTSMVRKCMNRYRDESTRSFDSRCFLAVHVELHEDDGIFENGSERPNKPRQVLEEVLFLNRVQQDLSVSAMVKPKEMVRNLTPAP